MRKGGGREKKKEIQAWLKEIGEQKTNLKKSGKSNNCEVCRHIQRD